jgi:signal transduction histidine kinase
MSTSYAQGLADWTRLPADDTVRLLAAAHELSRLRDLPGVMAVVRRHARDLMHADGVTFVLREGEQVFYADEDAIGPLWKGRRFPASACISGWAITHRESVAISDIYADPRIPVAAYRPTFVKSLLMVPIRVEDPIGAIGSYWASHHAADEREQLVLETLAGFTAVAVSNAQLYQEARDAVAARDQWIGIASHELRTPLMPIKIQLQAVARALGRGVMPVELTPRVQRAERSVDRLTRLIEQLLDYSRSAGDGLEVKPEPFDVVPLAMEVCDRFNGDDQGRAASVGVIAPAAVRGTWDRLRVEEILMNLVSNAVKYGRGRPVRVEVSGNGRGVRLAVTDQGDGIAPEDQERIFQPFIRLRESGQGVGLGLWIVRKIVQAHGGTIEVVSGPASGTSMVVSLPSMDGASPRPLAVV